MEETLRVPIGDVHPARRLGVRSQTGELRIFGDRSESSSVKMDVYTGWVDPGFPVWFLAGSDIDRRQARTFLPIDDQGHIREYQRDSIVDHTVTVSPATIGLDDDEATIFAVDGAPSVDLESQAFPGIAGNPFYLVLTANLVGLNISLRKITYQVTVLTSTVADRFHDLGDGDMPA